MEMAFLFTSNIVKKQLSIYLEVRSIQNVLDHRLGLRHIWIENYMNSDSITKKDYEKDAHEKQQIIELSLHVETWK